MATPVYEGSETLLERLALTRSRCFFGATVTLRVELDV